MMWKLGSCPSFLATSQRMATDSTYHCLYFEDKNNSLSGHIIAEHTGPEKHAPLWMEKLSKLLNTHAPHVRKRDNGVLS